MVRPKIYQPNANGMFQCPHCETQSAHLSSISRHVSRTHPTTKNNDNVVVKDAKDVKDVKEKHAKPCNIPSAYVSKSEFDELKAQYTNIVAMLNTLMTQQNINIVKKDSQDVEVQTDYVVSTTDACNQTNDVYGFAYEFVSKCDVDVQTDDVKEEKKKEKVSEVSKK